MKKTAYGLAISAVFLIVLYVSLWVYSAQWFRTEIDNIYAHASNEGIEFLGPKPSFANFPFVPEVYYSTGIKFGNTALLFPEMKVRGYPLPFTTLILSFPKGISLDGPVDPAIWSLDSLSTQLFVPYHLPKTFQAEELSAWQKTGGKVEIKHYVLSKQTLRSEGKGLLTLDENLQPVFSMESSIQGHETFIADQKEKGLIDPLAAAIGTTMLNGFAKPNPETQEKEVLLNVSVRDQMLSLGPLQVLPLPEIVWDRRRPLVLHR